MSGSKMKILERILGPAIFLITAAILVWMTSSTSPIYGNEGLTQEKTDSLAEFMHLSENYKVTYVGQGNRGGVASVAVEVQQHKPGEFDIDLLFKSLENLGYKVSNGMCRGQERITVDSENRSACSNKPETYILRWKSPDPQCK